MQQPDFWQDQNRAKAISKQAEDTKQFVEDWQDLQQRVDDCLVLASEALESDEDLFGELDLEYQKLSKQFAKMELAILFSGQYDRDSAVLTVHAGSGGTEAQDWAEMLLKMYLRFAENKGYASVILDESRGQETGFKSVTVEIDGQYAYGNLKSEAGVHRLVRISPFDAEKMRHTSFALVEVVPILKNEEESLIDEKDLKIETMRSSGHGGQGVNRTDSAVRITHLPSGLSVKCQNERSQVQNRKNALKILKAKLAILQQQAKGKKLDEIRGEVLSAEWGNQIRSYVLQPYKLVKDHRTELESTEPDKVLDGELDEFVESYLRYINKK